MYKSSYLLTYLLQIFGTLHRDLKWTTHIDKVCSKLHKLVGPFSRLRNKLSQNCFQMMYFAFAYPHTLYGIETYANTGITHLNKLMMLNNKI